MNKSIVDMISESKNKMLENEEIGWEGGWPEGFEQHTVEDWPASLTIDNSSRAKGLIQVRISKKKWNNNNCECEKRR